MDLGPRDVDVAFLPDGGADYDKRIQYYPVVSEIGLIDPVEFSTRPVHDSFACAVELGRRSNAVTLLRDAVPGLEQVEILTGRNGSLILHFVFADHSVPCALGGEGWHALTRLVLGPAAR